MKHVFNIDEVLSGYQPRQISIRNRRFEIHPETSVSYRHLTQLIAREDCINFSRSESARPCKCLIC